MEILVNHLVNCDYGTRYGVDFLVEESRQCYCRATGGMEHVWASVWEILWLRLITIHLRPN
mgnify:CR=1 FL=1